MMRPLHNSYGFTILEVMIAMAIFAIGILGIVKLQVSSTFSNTSSRTMSEATAAVADNIEQFVLNDLYDEILEGTAGPFVFKSDSGVDYNINRTVNEIKLNPPNSTYNVKQIITTVEWSDKGEDKTFSVTTYKSLTSDKGKSE